MASGLGAVRDGTLAMGRPGTVNDGGLGVEPLGDGQEHGRQGELLEQVDGLRRYAILLCGNPSDAEDLVQESLVRVLAHLRSLKPVNDIRAYLFTTLHNAFVDLTRRRRQFGDMVDIEGLEMVLTTPARQPHHVELLDLIAGLQQLSTEQRQVILLVGYEGMSYQEAASLLSVPIGTIMSRLSRARETLRRLTESPDNIGSNGGNEPKPKLRVVK